VPAQVVSVCSARTFVDHSERRGGGGDHGDGEGGAGDASAAAAAAAAVYYAVVVIGPQDEWTVYRRFSQFERLQKVLSSLSKEQRALPVLGPGGSGAQPPQPPPQPPPQRGAPGQWPSADAGAAETGGGGTVAIAADAGGARAEPAAADGSAEAADAEEALDAAALLGKLLPSKTWGRASAMEVQFRRVVLDAYVRELWRCEGTRMAAELRAFLRPGAVRGSSPGPPPPLLPPPTENVWPAGGMFQTARAARPRGLRSRSAARWGGGGGRAG
jgi:hypothetical protein